MDGKVRNCILHIEYVLCMYVLRILSNAIIFISSEWKKDKETYGSSFLEGGGGGEAEEYKEERN